MTDPFSQWREDLSARSPREVARAAIRAAVHDAAAAELGEARSDGDLARWKREQSPEHRRRHALACVDVTHELGLHLDEWIATARATGSTWQEIGDVVGSSRQQVHRRYARVDETAQQVRTGAPVAFAGPDPGPEPDRDAHDPAELGGYLECRRCGRGWSAQESAPIRCSTGPRIAAEPGLNEETFALLAQNDEDDERARLDEQQWHEEQQR